MENKQNCPFCPPDQSQPCMFCQGQSMEKESLPDEPIQELPPAPTTVKLNLLEGYTSKEINATAIEIYTPKGDTYFLQKKETRWTCSCTGYKFRQNCKHVKMLPGETRYPRAIIDERRLLIEPIMKHYGKFELCGSYRRGLETSKDMDYIIQTDPMNFAALRHDLNTAGIEITMGKDGAMRGSVNGVGVDIFRCDEHNYISLLIWRTGSKNHNIFCAIKAQKQGMKVTKDGIVQPDETIFYPGTEEAFYAKLGLDFIKPEDREM